MEINGLKLTKRNKYSRINVSSYLICFLTNETCLYSSSITCNSQTWKGRRMWNFYEASLDSIAIQITIRKFYGFVKDSLSCIFLNSISKSDMVERSRGTILFVVFVLNLWVMIQEAFCHRCRTCQYTNRDMC